MNAAACAQDNMLDIDCNDVPVQLQYIVQDHGGNASVALCPQGVTAQEIAAGASAPGARRSHRVLESGSGFR